MKKIMVALESLAPSKNLASPCPSENSVSFKHHHPQSVAPQSFKIK